MRFPKKAHSWTVAEFFAGIGLVRAGLESQGLAVVWANDVDPTKQRLYAANFGDDEFVLKDVRRVSGHELPRVDVATASFPCTDLSLAGNRAGLQGEHSGLFWEFTRIIGQMEKPPRALLVENVIGFASSNYGRDIVAALEALNELGYVCDVVVVDARWFVPQSRPRVFILGFSGDYAGGPMFESPLRPSWLLRLIARNSHLRVASYLSSPPAGRRSKLQDVVDNQESVPWWDDERNRKFEVCLMPAQRLRLNALMAMSGSHYRTAYRRTRLGKPVWEIRADDIAGCLRTARGGSSKQALVQAGDGRFRARWLTPREYARLQGVPDSFALDSVTEGQAYFALGDAVCVPVISWLASNWLAPILSGDSAALGSAVEWQMSIFQMK